MTADLLLRDARIVDGTGSPWFRGSVLIEDGQITDVGHDIVDQTVDVPVKEVGDQVLCPGFIDVHSHSDLHLFDEPTLQAKIRQGITTEILGQDGFSMAPMNAEDDIETWQQHLSGLDGRIDPDRWSWGGVEDYLDAIDEHGVAPNVATLVGHGTVRYAVLGMDDRAPSAAELEEMGELMTQALEEGAIGFSTGLIYPPQVHSETDELQTLVSRLSPFERPFVAHIRNQGRWIWEAIDEFLSIGAAEGVPLHYSHMAMYGKQFNRGMASRALMRLEDARERGIDVTADHHFFTKSSTMLQVLLPPWLQTAGPETMLERLREEETREQIREDIEQWHSKWWENYGLRDGWENITITSVASEENEDLEGMTLSEIASVRDDDPVNVICDLLVEEDLQVSKIVDTIDERDIETILSSERVAIASDGLMGQNPHPRTYGTYPRILGTFVREQGLLTLEEAVRKMTSLPARAMRLPRKGIICPGMDADLVIFDPDLVRNRATYEDPERYPSGITDVLVDGTFVIQEGEPTGETPGTTLRKDHD